MPDPQAQADPFAAFGGAATAPSGPNSATPAPTAPIQAPAPPPPAVNISAPTTPTAAPNFAAFGGSAVATPAVSTPKPDENSLPQEQQLQNRVSAITKHIADLKTRQYDSSGAEYDLLQSQKLLAQHQGVDTSKPNWINKLNLGTPTPGTTGGLETTGQQAASVAKETGKSLLEQGKTLLGMALDPGMIYHAYQMGRAQYQSHEQAVALAENTRAQQAAKVAELRAKTDDYLKHPDKDSGTLLANTIMAMIPLIGEARGLAAGGEAAEGAEAASEATAAKPGPIQQVIKGGNVVKQPEIQGAVRSGVNAASEEAGVSTAQPESLRNSASGHISSLEDAESAAYKAQDAAAGTDIKQLRQNLRNANYQKSILTKTPADIAKGKELDTSIQATQAEIDAANARLQAKGIDPGAADNLYKTRQAAQDFEDKVLHNQSVIKGDATAGQPETVDVDALVRESQKLYDKDKFGGSRLEQFMGKDGAAGYMKQIRALQTTRATAAARQAGALKILKALGVGGGILGGTALGIKGVEALLQ